MSPACCNSSRPERVALIRYGAIVYGLGPTNSAGVSEPGGTQSVLLAVRRRAHMYLWLLSANGRRCRCPPARHNSARVERVALKWRRGFIKLVPNVASVAGLSEPGCIQNTAQQQEQATARRSCVLHVHLLNPHGVCWGTGSGECTAESSGDHGLYSESALANPHAESPHVAGTEGVAGEAASCPPRGRAKKHPQIHPQPPY